MVIILKKVMIMMITVLAMIMSKKQSYAYLQLTAKRKTIQYMTRPMVK